MAIICNVHQFGEYFILETQTGELAFLTEVQYRILYFYSISKSASQTCDEILKYYNLEDESADVIRENVSDFIKNATRMNLTFDSIYVTGESKKYYPRVLNIEITNKCNFFCSHCYKNAKCTNHNYLDLEFFERFVKLFKGKISTLNLTGGEPCINPDFKKILRLLYDAGFTINLTSNASLIDTLTEDEIAYLNNIQISLYGFDEDSFGVITGSDKKLFYRVIENIKTLVKLGKRVTIGTVINKYVLANTDKFIEVVKGLGVFRLLLSPCVLEGRANENTNLWMVSENEIDSFMQKLKESEIGDLIAYSNDQSYFDIKTEHEEIGCGAGYLSYGISEKGIVYHCISLEGDIFEVGSIENLSNRCQTKNLDLMSRLNKCYNQKVRFLMCPMLEEIYEKVSSKK